MCVCARVYIDIEGTLKSIQPLPSSRDSHSVSGGGGEEYTDLVASDGELYLDTVDSLRSSQEGLTQWFIKNQV